MGYIIATSLANSLVAIQPIPTFELTPWSSSNKRRWFD